MTAAVREHIRSHLDLRARALVKLAFVAFCSICGEPFDVVPGRPGQPRKTCDRCRSGWHRRDIVANRGR